MRWWVEHAAAPADQPGDVCTANGVVQAPSRAGTDFHSDRGSQYFSHAFQAALKGHGMRSSMSGKGNCWDNAPTESLWGSLKLGRLYGKPFATHRHAMNEVIDWLTFYNHRRLHSTLGYISPMKFEENWYAGQSKKAA
jgi:transposase InsO family protein